MMRRQLRTPALLVAIFTAGLGPASCGGKSDKAGDGANASAAEVAPAADEAGTTRAETEAAPKEEAGPAPLEPAPPALVELAQEIVQAIDAEDKDALTEAQIDFETYSQDRIFQGLLRTPKAGRLGPKFAWDNLNEDSTDDRDRIVVDYRGKALEFVSLEFGEHEDKETVEIWDDIVLNVKIDGQPEALLILGEFIKDKQTGEHYLLRYHRRRHRAQ